ncbi:MAG: type II toxin-antitoxin system Phd/YefM family antitoxin [Puniceicoccaceae bacterium]
MKSTWQVQEAKNKFSEVLERAAKEPQVITRHGRKAGVLMSYAEYRKRLSTGKRTIRSLYAAAPKFDDGELDFERDRDSGREVIL